MLCAPSAQEFCTVLLSMHLTVRGDRKPEVGVTGVSHCGLYNDHFQVGVKTVLFVTPSRGTNHFLPSHLPGTPE
jgi:hypothetical protein